MVPWAQALVGKIHEFWGLLSVDRGTERSERETGISSQIAEKAAVVGAWKDQIPLLIFPEGTEPRFPRLYLSHVESSKATAPKWPQESALNLVCRQYNTLFCTRTARRCSQSVPISRLFLI
jgi:hypothetical protein